ncbi:MAG TPA: hypothetical protein VHI13_06625 [Candidatus Kapabacteria bacterium]|nr:hypothetical protein [Candidatus Kapabacteria bacterium]
MKSLTDHWPAFAGAFVLMLATTTLLAICIANNNGTFVYAMDDAYIHMAVARNLVRHGVWGVAPYEFSSCTSSILWPLMLASSYSVTGVNEFAPFVLNLLAATALVVYVSALLKRHGIGPRANALVLAALIALTPLVTLIFCGMEHVLHTFLALMFASSAARLLASGNEPSDTVNDPYDAVTHDRRTERRYFIRLMVLAPLVTAVRFEGMFMLAVVVLLLAIKRRYRHAMILGMVGLTPVLIFAAVSVGAGWYPLPNSVLIKGNRPDLASAAGIMRIMGGDGYHQLIAAPHIVMLVIAAMVLVLVRCWRDGTIWGERTMVLVIFLGTCLLHMEFARTGWFFRYEAYIVALGLVSLAIAGGEHIGSLVVRARSRAQMVTASGLVLLLALPGIERGTDAVTQIPDATTSTYELHRTMGRFLAAYYEGSTVVAHDIGAISYYADVRLLDLAGLASLEVVNAKRKNIFTNRWVADFAHRRHAAIAVAFPGAFEHWGNLPKEWIPVREWRGSVMNPIYGTTYIRFYAVDSSEAGHLAACLDAFSASVPASVIQVRLVDP